MQVLIAKLNVLSILLCVSIIFQAVPFSSALSRDEISVENVRFQVIDEKITVYFDVIGPEDKKYKVRLLLRRESKRSFNYAPKNLVGDVGTGRYAGRNRQITWDLRNERPEGVEGDDYFFVVEVELVSGGISPLVWIGAGALAVGGGAALLLSSKKEEGAPPVVTTGFPIPPGRPPGQ